MASSAYYCFAVREMPGIGAAFNDAACYMLNQLHTGERAALQGLAHIPGNFFFTYSVTAAMASSSDLPFFLALK